MKITNIKIRRIIPNKGHVGFFSCIIDNWLYLNNIAIFTRLSDPSKIRLVFPEKKLNDKRINIFYPVKTDAYAMFEKIIQDKMNELL